VWYFLRPEIVSYFDLTVDNNFKIEKMLYFE
jgi:hypothetical protein